MWCLFFFWSFFSNISPSVDLFECLSVSGQSLFWGGEKYGAVRLTEILPWSEASSGHSGKMFRGWRTQFAPLRPIAEPLNWNSVALTHLALWIFALGFVAGSEPSAVESLHHIHLSHGNKRHHTVPIAIHRSPASLRAGHSKYFSHCMISAFSLCGVFLSSSSLVHFIPYQIWLLIQLFNITWTIFFLRISGDRLSLAQIHPCFLFQQSGPSHVWD